MDHITPVHDPVRPVLKIPLLCLAGVDDGLATIQPAHSYHWQKDQFLFGSVDNDTLVLAAPFIQSWLWFGTIEEVLRIVNVDYDPSDFVQRDCNSLWSITTALLPRYICYWVASEGETSVAEKEVRLRCIDKCIQQIYDVIQPFTRMEDSQDLEEIQSTTLGPVVRDDRRSHILLSLIVLAETLAAAKQGIYNDLVGSSWSWDETESVREWLIEAGWCLKDLETFVEMAGPGRVTVLYFVSYMRRNVFGKDHALCSLKACVYATTVQDDYKTIHTTSKCTCEHLALKDSDHYPINDILRQKAIPLISIALGNSDNARITLTESAPIGRRPVYVAISHVWSDGLGNPLNNSLPICQLQLIQSLVDSLYPEQDKPVPFWIDTLCVPLDDAGRNAAVKSMTRVYAEADKVLVLDSFLATSSVQASPEECVMRIHASTWTRRLWTFQESALAGRIYFRFRDGIIDGDVLDSRYWANNDSRLTVRIEDLCYPSNNTRLYLDVNSLSNMESSTDQSDSSAGDDSEEETDDNEELRRLTAESKARTAAIEAQIATLKTQIGSIRARFPCTNDERRELNAHISLLRTQRPPQCPVRRLAPDLAIIPAQWLIEEPTIQDNHLRALLDRLTWCSLKEEPEYMSGFRAFDFIHQSGLLAFDTLRIRGSRRYGRGALVPTARQLEEVWSAIQWRSTTKAEDEAICLGTLLDLDMSALLEVPKTRRMLKFASMLEHVPAMTAFLQCARLTDEGYRWMPASFLALGRYLQPSLEIGHGFRLPAGLLMRAPGFFLDLNDCLEDHKIIFNTGTNVCEVSFKRSEDLSDWACIQGSGSAVILEHLNVKYKI